MNFARKKKNIVMLPKPCSQYVKHVEKAIYQWTGFCVVRISIAKTFVMAVHN